MYILICLTIALFRYWLRPSALFNIYNVTNIIHMTPSVSQRLCIKFKIRAFLISAVFTQLYESWHFTHTRKILSWLHHKEGRFNPHPTGTCFIFVYYLRLSIKIWIGVDSKQIYIWNKCLCPTPTCYWSDSTWLGNCHCVIMYMFDRGIDFSIEFWKFRQCGIFLHFIMHTTL